MKPGIDLVLVQPDDPKDTVKIGDVVIQLVTRFNPGNFAVQSGTVIEPPTKLSEVSRRDLYHPQNGKLMGSTYDRSRMFDVRIILQPGDKVFFHHNAINDSVCVGDNLYLVHHHLCYAFIRNEELHCMDGQLLAEPIMEDTSDLITKSGIILVPDIEVKEKPKYLRARARYVGRPAIHEVGLYDDLVPGAEFIYTKESDIPLKVGEETFYRMRHNEAMAIIPEGSEHHTQTKKEAAHATV